MTQARFDLGFQQVRFHGLLDDDMSVVLPDGSYSFFNVDQAFDFLLSIGMKPLVEVSFMPSLLASGNTTVFHYKAITAPPSDYMQWFDLVQALVQHLVDRYGLDEIRTWSFEVWNEPQCSFWSGTQAEYFTLYNYTATAIKSVDKMIAVGGPASCQSGWIPELINFTDAYNVPIDFISTHTYPTDLGPNQTRDTMLNVFEKARQQAGKLPLYYTEYNDGLYVDPDYHNVAYSAAFIFKTVNDGQGVIDLLSWWTFTDIFEEQGMTSAPFESGPDWGLLSRYGTPKPSYRAFELLHRAGTQSVPVSSSNPDATVGAFAIINEQMNNELSVFLYNIDVPGNPVSNYTVTLTVTGQKESTAEIFYIDDSRVNPMAAWRTMGSPVYPTRQQIDQMNLASLVLAEPVQCTVNAQQNTVCTFDMLPQSAAVVRF